MHARNDYAGALMNELFAEYKSFIESLPMSAMRVTAVMADDFVTTRGIRLDAILSFAVVDKLTRGMMLPDKTPYVQIPIPVGVEMFCKGVPLYQATDFLPEAHIRSVRYLHRRSLEPSMTQKNLNTGSGQFKELRTPLSAIPRQKLVAECVGNADEIQKLLSTVSAIGKKRTSSGAVKQWEVERIDVFSMENNGVALKNLPLEYLIKYYGSCRLDLSLAGFSPPYWHKDTQTNCVLAGSKI